MRRSRLVVLFLCVAARASLAQDPAADPFVTEELLIETRDGTPIAAIIVRSADSSAPQPTALLHTIYLRPSDLDVARYAARWGYASVLTYARGVKTGATEIQPYEHDAEDVYDVIDWISKQPWSDGQVGMYGGSYAGFAQWAVARLGHPALKTIVPQVAVSPGLGEPFDFSSIFVTQLAYVWPLTYAHNLQARETFTRDWYRSGAAYRELDRFSGVENATFNRWVEHPEFDEFWQAIATDGDEFEDIDIPVLTTTGYYDDAQVGALHYFREHYRHKPDAEHYLVIGPYDHFGGQVRPSADLRGYAIDASANYLMGDLALEWLDHVLKGEERPALVADRVNYQVMGANVWKHAPSIETMSNNTMRFYLDSESESQLLLTLDRPAGDSYRQQLVDFADRDTEINIYTSRIINDTLIADNALVFISDPMDEGVELSGNVSGELVVTINKRDVDLNFALYEQMADGRYFFLNRYLGRASYAQDNSSRQLLNPGERTTIPFSQTKISSRLLGEGSRLVLVVGVNKHSFEQINYGTGRDVSDESIADAGAPLEIRWHSGSFIDVPFWRQ